MPAVERHRETIVLEPMDKLDAAAMAAVNGP
jgi:hypothetical protein